MASGLGKILEKLFPAPPEGRIPWELEVDLARHEQEPLRARTLLYLCLLVVLALVVWAAYAPIEEVTRGQGRVIPSRQVQIIQAIDGGVVSEILVAEGDTVTAGQTLLRIDPTRFISELRQNRAQLYALQAKAERLKALSEGRPFKPSKELEKEIPDIVRREKTLYASSLSERQAQSSIARQQLAQRQKELKEAIANRDQLQGRIELLKKELNVTRPLVSSGAVSEVEVLRLERDLLATEGERDQVKAQIERIESAISEARNKI
ncbi:MAG: biotin/lipoyl-binding protein, partial [Deltaproteobacteria bacterium]